MFCKNCGTQIDDDSLFCEKCGTAVKHTKKVEIVSTPQGESKTPKTDCPLPSKSKDVKSRKKVLVVGIVLILAVLGSILLFTNNSPSAMNYSLDAVDPYLKYIGGTQGEMADNLSQEDVDMAKQIEVCGIVGEITSGTKSYNGLSLLDHITWTANESDNSEKEFINIVKTLVTHYGVDTGEESFWDGIKEITLRNEAFDITAKHEEDGTITINWISSLDHLNKGKIAGVVAASWLQRQLKNPNSLQVHNVAYVNDVTILECKDPIGVIIDYSAQNSFGGYVRNTYYTLVHSETFREVNTFLGAESTLDYYINKSHSVSISGNNYLRNQYSTEMSTYLISYTNKSNDFEQMSEEDLYNQAIIAMDAQLYNRAINYFTKANDYKDSTQKIEQCKIALENEYQGLATPNDKYTQTGTTWTDTHMAALGMALVKTHLTEDRPIEIEKVTIGKRDVEYGDGKVYENIETVVIDFCFIGYNGQKIRECVDINIHPRDSEPYGRWIKYKTMPSNTYLACSEPIGNSSADVELEDSYELDVDTVVLEMNKVMDRTDLNCYFDPDEVGYFLNE